MGLKNSAMLAYMKFNKNHQIGIFLAQRIAKMLIWTTLSVFFSTGCTTAKTIQGAGKALSEGHILGGVYMGTMGVAVSAIVDVFTLGGIASPAATASFVQGATESRKESKNSISSNPAISAQQRKEVNIKAVQSGMNNMQIDAAYRKNSNCLRYIPQSNEITYKKYRNVCDFPVYTSSYKELESGRNRIATSLVQPMQEVMLEEYYRVCFKAPKNLRDEEGQWQAECSE